MTAISPRNAAPKLLAAALVLTATTALAKQNSCDDPIVIGTTISMTGPLASLTPGWDQVTERSEEHTSELQSLV